MGWSQAATGRAAAALFGENPCNRTFRWVVSVFGVVAAPPGGGPSGKERLKQARIPRLAGLGRQGQRSRTVSVPLREEQRGLDPTFGVYRSPSFLLGGSRRRGGSEHPDSDFIPAGLNIAARPPSGRRSAGADSSPTSDRSISGRRGRSGTASAQTRSRTS